MNPVTVILVLLLGVLFFGKDLPEVAKRVGLSLMEFKKGMSEAGGSARTTKAVSKRVAANDDDWEAEEIVSSAGTKFEPPL